MPLRVGAFIPLLTVSQHALVIGQVIAMCQARVSPLNKLPRSFVFYPFTFTFRWMSTQPLDMRAGTETALARVVQVFGAAHPYHAYLFANARANRMKVLVHDGFGVWLAARSLNQGKLAWGDARLGSRLTLRHFSSLLAATPWSFDVRAKTRCLSDLALSMSPIWSHEKRVIPQWTS